LSARNQPALPASASRYTIFGQIGAGGMATVQYAQFTGPGGFARPVAIKRLHAHLAHDPDFSRLFLDEALLTARIAHANVVATLDVLSAPGEISVVMEYIHGESLAALLSAARARQQRVPYRVAAALLASVLHGLHAAHQTTGEHGESLGIVHRDVSPENILVGSDGVARLLDFGIAKARGRVRVTPRGELKGKLGYMAPEQYLGQDIDHRVDVYSASVVLWEALTGRSLHQGASDALVVDAVMHAHVVAPSTLVSELPLALDVLVLRGLSRERNQRFASAREMALALEREVDLATQSEVSDWVHDLAGDVLRERALLLQQLRRQVLEAGEGAEGASTRRLPATLAAQAPTRALDEPTRAALRTAPSSARSGTRLRRPAPWLFGCVALLTLCGALWWSATLARSGQQASSSGAPMLAPSTLAPSMHKPDAMNVAPSAPRPALAPSAGVLPAATVLPAPALLGVTQPSLPATVDSASGAEPGKSRRDTARTSSRAARKALECAQPFEVDALGIRRWKRQCL
jgi:hypothetical protein